MKEQHKLAAIMFTDITGYSAMMSKDEKMAMRVLEKNRLIHKSSIAKFNGEYIKEVGDGTLAIFQSSIDAVNCAIAIQKACCKESLLKVRIGIHIGDIILKGGDVFGDGVNIASRIEAAGEPGGIYISEKAYDDIKNKAGIRTEYYGEKLLKNIPDPVRIYSITSGDNLEEEEFQAGGKIEKKETLLHPSVKIVVPVILIGVVIIIVSFLLLNHRAKVRWAAEVTLPEIEELYNKAGFTEAFNLAIRAERFIPENPELKDWLTKVVGRLTVLTDPPGAEVYFKKYSDTAGTWQNLGRTPIDSIKFPVATFYRFKFEKPGYETIFAVTSTDIDTLSRKLFEKGSIPAGMIHVDGYWDEVKNTFETKNGFFLDKYEVTNRQYKEFIDQGGYSSREYWKNEFIRDGKELSWEEAISEFVDKTGRPGPSTWEAGDYPDEQDDYPVAGVSWYEAAAYAEYAGKVLPTGDHWDSGAGFDEDVIINYFASEICPVSNYGGKGPEPVGRSPNISCYGALDMAGNVREWNWNETNAGRLISGGGWSDENYMFTEWDHLPPFDRSSVNGFRCALYLDKSQIPLTAFRFIEMALRGKMDYSMEIPVPESTFLIYKNQFLYDKKALNARIEEKNESPEDWIVEKVSFDAAYDNQRMILYLFLPRNSSPPYQTLIFFPGSNAIIAKDLQTEGRVNGWLDFVLKSGRAVAYPVFFRTFERNDGKIDYYPAQNHQYTEVLIKWVKDFSRTIDYLDTRTDIDTAKLGFYGYSWGGRLGGIIPAVENRLAVNILVVGGFSNARPYPEADGINYVSRIKIPTLMLNGRYDASFPLEKSVIPFFRLLGTPEVDKRLCIYETSHNILKSNKIREILNWCDKYLGPVK